MPMAAFSFWMMAAVIGLIGACMVVAVIVLLVRSDDDKEKDGV